MDFLRHWPASRIALMLVLLVTGVASPGGTALGQAAPALSLNPTQGAVGASVTATASGFAPGDRLSLFVFPMTKPVATATADASGGARIAFTVPEIGPGAAGAHEVAVESPSGPYADATFTITGGSKPLAPTVSLSQTQGAVGASVTATASGFVPGTRLSLFVSEIGGFVPKEPLATATADANGGARIAFTVPNIEAGWYQVTVLTQGEGASASASAPFTIAGGFQPSAPAVALSPAQGPVGGSKSLAPTVSFNPAQGAVGASVTATASGFLPGARLSLLGPLELACEESHAASCPVLATATADANGGARIPFTVPNVDVGSYQVVVRAEGAGEAGGYAITTLTVVAAGATARPTAAATPSARTATPVPNAVPAAPTATPVPNATPAPASWLARSLLASWDALVGAATRVWHALGAVA